ncbi:N-acetyllactosaminide beta-1,3-N-acetylglucosaminyltransferase 3-like [Xiphophorus couchianus]|uniref:N-acetyllactosaminide beta-1,3-N-acetylglucosaminyltransferase 3-like n=1 Tax=Xiphophorus couchianus TaxID=32473 RepID=UPI00101648EB|nr:N-acetyllactosaminide beta-1,3-N-acetylglucosaminyltransferase 3-like [Xiphophorus couchianus]
MRSFSRGTIAVPFVLGVIFMVIYFYRYSADFTNYNFFSRPVTDVFNNDNQSETVTKLHTQEVLVPKCEANMSVADIKDFSSLPDALKNFLYYRHCRTFPLLLDLPDKCGRDNRYKEVFLLLVIKSSPLNYDRREVLRKTWAKERLHKGMWIRRIFILGTSGTGNEKKKLNRLLTEEQKDFNDILQWDFNDMFYNLTLKQMLFYGWMERNCPNARFLLNGDDDVFAHTDNMMEYLRNLPDNDGSKHLFTGYVFLDGKVVRWSGSKYFIPVQIQESNTYLPYCGGGGYLLSGYTAMVIYRMSQSIPIHPIDDAYMGMCLSKAGLSPSSHSGVKTLGINIPSEGPDNLEACYLRDLLLVHRFLPADMYLMWKEVHDPHLKCDP